MNHIQPMLGRNIKFGSLLPAAALLLLCGLSAVPAAMAQRRIVFLRVQGQVRAERIQGRRIPPPGPPPGPGAPQERRMLGLPPRWAAQLREMTPQQQQRFLNNNQRFLELPPARQAQVRRQLQVWNNLAPEQRQAILERERVWEQMTPAQQGYVRNTLLPQWQEMPPVRRQIILGKLRDLRGLDDSQRAVRLNDEVFLSGLGPHERQMLRDLSNLRVAGPEPPEPAEPPGF